MWYPIGKHSRSNITAVQTADYFKLVYAIVTIPVAVCRLGVLVGWKPPFWLFVFAGTTFAGSGPFTTNHPS